MTPFRTLVVLIYTVGAVIRGKFCYDKYRKQQDVIGEEAVQQKIHDHAAKVSGRILKLSGCRLTVNGIENVPKEGAVLYACNHQSFMDIPVMMVAVNRPTGFVAKEELGKIPFFRDWVSQVKGVLIARGDTRKALVSILQAAKNLQQGHCMVIYPEGTRTFDGILVEFKAGALKAAQKGNAAIVPVAIDGAIDIMKRGSLWVHKADVTVTFMPAIPAEEVKVTETKVLADRVKKQVADVLGQEFVPQAVLDELERQKNEQGAERNA